MLPVFHAESKEDEPQRIGLSEGRLFDLAAEDDQWLPEQSIFGNQFRFTPGELGGAENNRMAGRLGVFELC